MTRAASPCPPATVAASAGAVIAATIAGATGAGAVIAATIAKATGAGVDLPVLAATETIPAAAAAAAGAVAVATAIAEPRSTPK